MSKKIRRAQVISSKQISPHLMRVVVGSDEFADFPIDQQGAYVKVLFPHEGKTEVELNLKADNPAPMRSYTIRNIDPHSGAITLDFVINQHRGIATNWAKQAKIGDNLGIAGPGPRKLSDFSQSEYLLIGDLTSVNAINGYLQKLPASASVNAIIHVPDEGDIIELDTVPSHYQVNWLVSEQPQVDLINAVITQLTASNSRSTGNKPVIFMALESSLIREINTIARSQFAIARENIACSAYWKQGITADGLKVEKQHQSNA
ncbi:siderophore-interacting protein [Pseudoalteromonas shioyasakiensis]|uniref:siderophore-interacting protein n=1 Tax=Pseudoalteromonas shioyasakiensis TaxID=1190813 RepID=UPI00211798E3|nr:siderophore-interacting protein [Pseudoalteromonas shioyasakiensis]MCQ8878304.1 siderophore-interacting protein [Pseudoalteromonas shioyasakiensis]